eukprot:TRINITY_DN27732_c2_g2_i1.p2 TRINITY_DN27732_c2_g2~~TRINITY_DN27732_c2_g2_i1.p2  ORF type:complete len:421 (-),score=30.09 TRINITY_DN27732_c2_g2_i1:227-1489(-)
MGYRVWSIEGQGVSRKLPPPQNPCMQIQSLSFSAQTRVRMKVGIIGGGICGLVCAQQLSNRGLTPIVLDMGAYAGGRTCSKFIERGLQFDYGCQFINIESDQIYAKQIFNNWKSKGVIQPWKPRFFHYNEREGTFVNPQTHLHQPGFCNFVAGQEDGERSMYVGYPSMRALTNYLATNLDAQVRTGFRVDSAKYNGQQWLLSGKYNKSISTEEIGPFDALVFTDLLNAKSDSSGYVCDNEDVLSSFYNDMVQEARSQKVHTLMLAFSREEMDNVTFDALSVYNSQYFQWICRDSSKPGRREVSNYDCWVAITTSDYSEELSKQMTWVPRNHPDRQIFLDTLSSAILLQLQQSLKYDNFPVPIYKTVQRWGSGFLQPLSTRNFYYQKDIKVVACGDFCTGSRIDLVVQSAVEASNYIVNNF